MKIKSPSLTLLRKGGIYLNFTTERTAFWEAAKRATHIAPAASPLDILRCTLLETDTVQRTLSITASNAEMTLKQMIPLLSYEGDDCCFAIDARMLAEMLGHLDGATVDFEQKDAGLLTIASDSAVYQISVQDGKTYPQMSIPFPEDTVKVSAIPSMVGRTGFAAAENGTMPLLKCLNLKFTSQGLRAIGSDGSCVVSAKGDMQSTGNISLLVPAMALERLARLCNDKDVFSVGTTGKQIVFLRENFAFSVHLMEGSYVDTDRLIGNLQHAFTALSDAAELKTAISSVATLSPDNKVLFQFHDGRLCLRCNGECGEAVTAIDVIPLTGTPTGEYCFAANRLERCLRTMGGAITIGIAHGGMLTLSTESAFYMQTALRMKQSGAKPALQAA